MFAEELDVCVAFDEGVCRYCIYEYRDCRLKQSWKLAFGPGSVGYDTRLWFTSRHNQLQQRSRVREVGDGFVADRPASSCSKAMRWMSWAWMQWWQLHQTGVKFCLSWERHHICAYMSTSDALLELSVYVKGPPCGDRLSMSWIQYSIQVQTMLDLNAVTSNRTRSRWALWSVPVAKDFNGKLQCFFLWLKWCKGPYCLIQSFSVLPSMPAKMSQTGQPPLEYSKDWGAGVERVFGQHLTSPRHIKRQWAPVAYTGSYHCVCCKWWGQQGYTSLEDWVMRPVSMQQSVRVMQATCGAKRWKCPWRGTATWSEWIQQSVHAVPLPHAGRSRLNFRTCKFNVAFR